ncbi:hypothetical protein BD770DRAFT_383140 [Pilaira anomala]|nr:hypothetical protein BD770DRAFT_383140 [Pilaira anomala]
MMQHYRTHMSPKSRRSQKRGLVDEARPRPRLHAHHRIKSDPVQIEPPLTIDQHLSNYHQSLTAPLSNNHSRFNFPVPLSSIARTPSNLKKLNSNNTTPTPISQTTETCSSSPTLSHSSSTSLHIRDESITSSRPTSPDNEPSPSTSSSSSTTLFYQHRPLTFSRPQSSGFPYTLLHPAQGGLEDNNLVTPNQPSGNSSTTNQQQDPKDDPMDEDESPSTGGLHQLAHIVSTFG